MRFENYKKVIVALVAATALILGLYLETKAPETIDINKIDFSNAAVIGLTRGQLICSENADIEFVYQNYTNKISIKQICDALNGNSKKTL